MKSLNEIFENISKIDTEAFENEQKNKAILADERRRLENKLKSYREHHIKEAEEKAKNIYDSIVSDAKKTYELKEKEINEFSGRIKARYQKVEKDIIKRVMETLFLNH